MKIRSFYEKLWGNHSLLTITITAIVLRALFIPVQSGDYVEYLHPWFLELQQNGGLSSIGRPVGNYMVSYIYILALLTHLPVPDLISIKAVSFLGDIFLAMYVKKLAFAVWKDEKMSNILYTMILFLPTVFLNSAAWAQCDGIYTAALIACLYYLQKECPHQAMIAFSVAFVFKLQAVFLAPFLLAVFLQKRIRIRHCFWVPAIYAFTILPAFLAGRPLQELLLLYVDQAGTYQALSMNAPNLFAWFPPFYENSFLAGCGILAAAIAALAVPGYVWYRNIELKGEALLWTALFSLFWIPFLLPHMHERYFFAADILAVTLFMGLPKEKYTILLIPMCSLLLSIRFLTGALWISPAVLSIPMLIAGGYLIGKMVNLPARRNEGIA